MDIYDEQDTVEMPVISDDTITEVIPVFQEHEPVRRRSVKPSGRHRRRIGRVIAIVPARNEAADIGNTVRALRSQTHQVDEVYVVTNNCTDDGATATAAFSAGARIIDAGHCPDYKPQALNRALSQLLPHLDDDDYVLIQDGDTELNEGFTRAALAVTGPGVGGVCARYDTHDPRGLLQRLQANEFTRSRRKTTRSRNRAQILVGIASVFSVAVIRHVIKARTDGLLPGTPTFYNETSLCEDYRLTLDLKALGYELVCPADCRPRTDAMPTLKKLWGQRVRWARGGLDDLRELGYNRTTRPYFWAQWNRQLVMLAPLVYVAYLTSLEVDYHVIVWDLAWLWINALTVLERVITVRKGGWKAVLIAALIVPELAYDWFQAAAYLTGVYKHLRSKPVQWKET